MSENICQDADGDGCGQLFVNKSALGLCAKCVKLSKLTEGTPEYITWKAYVQCTSCGVAWKNFQGGVCGPCKVSDRDGQNIQTTIKSATDAARAAHLVAVDQRLNKNKPGKAIHSTAGLDNAKANTATGASDNDQVLIIFQCRLKTNRTKDPINYGTGSWGKSWARSDFIQDMPARPCRRADEDKYKRVHRGSESAMINNQDDTESTEVSVNINEVFQVDVKTEVSSEMRKNWKEGQGGTLLGMTREI
ncbi:hypothetical protein FB446DRAFT_775307 [Lentinula raphanica]|nr:hypothetical protein FB446DRAFT_775307 [Lentinula raphanica]